MTAKLNAPRAIRLRRRRTSTTRSSPEATSPQPVTSKVARASSEATPSRDAAGDCGPMDRASPSATTTRGSIESTARATSFSSTSASKAVARAVVTSGTVGRNNEATSTTAASGPTEAAASVTSTTRRLIASSSPGVFTAWDAAWSAGPFGTPASTISWRSQLETMLATCEVWASGRAASERASASETTARPQVAMRATLNARPKSQPAAPRASRRVI